MKIHPWSPAKQAFLWCEQIATLSTRTSFDINTNMRLTFLKCSRLHEILPKTTQQTGFLVLIIRVGSNFLISFEYKYQSNRRTSTSISLNSFPSSWPNSHVANTIVYDQLIWTSKAIQTIKLFSLCYNRIWIKEEIVWEDQSYHNISGEEWKYMDETIT